LDASGSASAAFAAVVSGVAAGEVGALWATGSTGSPPHPASTIVAARAAVSTRARAGRSAVVMGTS
jgi:hypothetical protein